MRTKADVRQRSRVYEFTPRGSTLWLLFLVTAIFIAVCVLDADFHAVPGSVFIDVTSVVPISVRVVPVSVPPLSVSSTIHVAIAAHLTVAMHSPVWTRLTVIAAGLSGDEINLPRPVLDMVINIAHLGKLETGKYSKVIYGLILIQINDDHQFTPQLTSID